MSASWLLYEIDGAMLYRACGSSLEWTLGLWLTKSKGWLESFGSFYKALTLLWG